MQSTYNEGSTTKNQKQRVAMITPEQMAATAPKLKPVLSSWLPELEEGDVIDGWREGASVGFSVGRGVVTGVVGVALGNPVGSALG